MQYISHHKVVVVLSPLQEGEARMLVLTRSKGQKVKIGHDIVITVVQIQGGRVRLGFKAPENIRILRDEIDDENPPQDITVACNTG